MTVVGPINTNFHCMGVGECRPPYSNAVVTIFPETRCDEDPASASLAMRGHEADGD